MGISWLRAKLKYLLAIIAWIFSLVSSVVTIGGFNMSSFWENLFGTYSTTWPIFVAVANTIITTFLIYWVLRCEKRIAKWKADCHWLYDENDRLQALVNKFIPKAESVNTSLSASIGLEQTTPNAAKKGEIHNHFDNE